MSSSSYIKSQITSYYTFLDNVKKTRDYLSEAFSNLEKASDVGEYFSVDGESADSGEIKNVFENINKTRDYLTDVIIPAIEAKISSLKKELKQAEIEEAEG